MKQKPKARLQGSQKKTAKPKAGLSFSEKKRLKELQRTLAGNHKETLWTRTQKADHETGAADNK